MRKALYDRLFERRNLRLAAAVHYASDVERGHAEAAGVEGRAFVAPLGVDAGTFTSDAGASFARRHPELAEQKLVTFLGRITEKKGLDILLDALAVMQEPGVRLVVAGPDDEGLAAQLRKRAARLGIADRVSFIGPVTDEKSALLARSAVFVLPSRDENFGIAVVEAMAAGVPVVVTRGVAIHDIVADAGAGIVVERSPNAVADALKRVLDDDDLASSLGRNAAALARAQFTWDNRVVEVERMYYEAITG